MTIKRSLGRNDFQVDPRVLHRALLDNGYGELPITSEHAVYVDQLPQRHRDPFDRVLVAQAILEGITVLTNDQKLLGYPGAIRKGVMPNAIEMGSRHHRRPPAPTLNVGGKLLVL